MLSKDYFCKVIDKVKEYNTILDELPEWISFDSFPLIDFGFDMVDLLDKEMGTDDDKNGGLVFSWCYEHDFGAKYPDIRYELDETGKVIKLDNIIPGYLVAIDGVNYAPKTAKELYDLVVNVWTGN